jgi:hypothetical protein
MNSTDIAKSILARSVVLNDGIVDDEFEYCGCFRFLTDDFCISVNTIDNINAEVSVHCFESDHEVYLSLNGTSPTDAVENGIKFISQNLK